MKTGPQAVIISCNQEQEAVCASAARISTTPGGAEELFQAARGNEKNRPLIAKVLGSGHKSMIEHAVFTVAMSGVSVLAEQFFIEHRLASFTVKSRRYVDFSNQGYYVPPELAGEGLAAYRRYMDLLFDAYGVLLERGVPKEDARFLLPYALHSSFYCTVNARELAHMLRAMRRGSPELQSLADQLTAQLEEVFPCLLPELSCAAEEPAPRELPDVPPVFLARGEAGTVRLLSAPQDPAAMLREAYRAGHREELPSLEELLRSPRPRELEQLHYTFRVSDVTLSGITHIVRHRMQSVMIPPVESTGRYILPHTLEGESRAFYVRTLEQAHGMARELMKDSGLRRYGGYFAVSGGVMDIMTTMNARELQHFIRLRTCSRAQWEIQDIAADMLRRLRGSWPELFGYFGPGCFIDGQCPEGAMSCGQMDRATARFARLGGEDV